MDADVAGSCSLSADKEDTQAYDSKCVRNIMYKMNNNDKCVNYFTGIFGDEPNTRGCSLNDINKICNSKKTFTQKNAVDLCNLLNDAHEKFWKNIK